VTRKLAVLVALCLMVGCQTDIPMRLPSIPGTAAPDDVQIASLLNDAHRGMQSRRIYQVMAHVSRSYRDAEGRDFAGVQSYLDTVFRRYRQIRITRVPPRIVVAGNQARAVETFGTLAEPVDPSETPPINIQGQVTVYLDKVGDSWKIVEWSNLP